MPVDGAVGPSAAKRGASGRLAAGDGPADSLHAAASAASAIVTGMVVDLRIVVAPNNEPPASYRRLRGKVWAVCRVGAVAARGQQPSMAAAQQRGAAATSPWVRRARQRARARIERCAHIPHRDRKST